jgi:Cof subfamily protein (haloacid dehalogenase superfamily)
MPSSPSRTPYRLAALDLDGTLLGPDLTISPENHAAVAALHAAGLTVVLASGRHFSSMQPYTRQLPAVQWIVSAQGGEVADRDRTTVLSRLFLQPTALDTLLALESTLSFSAVHYTPDGVCTESAPNPALTFYTNLAGLHPARVDRATLERRHVHKTVWIGTPAAISALRTDARVAALPLQCLQTHAELYEFMPVETTKATGLHTLATHLGFTPAQVVAFGDAENDISMFDWAGNSFAMPHGWPTALARARQIAPAGPPATALARAVTQLLNQ